MNNEQLSAAVDEHINELQELCDLLCEMNYVTMTAEDWTGFLFRCKGWIASNKATLSQIIEHLNDEGNDDAECWMPSD